MVFLELLCFLRIGIFFLHKYSSESVSVPKMLIMTCSHPLSVVYDKRKETWLTVAFGYLRGRVSS